jgi:4-diphosphocytidyl-2-C-methyl-D-erythritol kinase
MIIKKSFAKINLYLKVTGKRVDGYHFLDSLMVLIDIFDLIKIESSSRLELVIKGVNCKSLQQDWQNNIIIKAVNLLASYHNFFPKVKITLQKNIPIAAGLGGGSSNAACVMLMINDFYQLDLKPKQLFDFGLQIGADVPFFLNALINQKPVLVSGIGNILINYDKKLPDWHLLIINPNIPLSTQKIFTLFDKNNSFPKNYYTKSHPSNEDVIEYKPKPLSPFLANHYFNSAYSWNLDQEILTLIKNRSNDLEDYASKIVPEIASIINFSEEQSGCLLARMSGSGASCFAVFNDIKDLQSCSYKLQKNFPSFYTKQSSFLTKNISSK